MIARAVLLDWWTLFFLACLAAFFFGGYRMGVRDGWHRGRAALIREQKLTEIRGTGYPRQSEAPVTYVAKWSNLYDRESE